MNQRPYFNPRNFQPPPRNFLPPTHRAPFNPGMNIPMHMQGPRHFNQNMERPRMMQHQNFQQRPRMPDNNQQAQMQMQMNMQMEMQRKRPLSPPEPPRFSDLVPIREEPKSNPINPAYKTAVDEELVKLENKLKQHLSDPESHPFYGKEWQLFWNRKADELAKRGEDPSDYDFKDEWCEFFIDRIRELHDEETKWKVEQIQRKYGVTDCEYPVLKKARAGSIERSGVVDDKKDVYESDDDDYRQYKDEIRGDRTREEGRGAGFLGNEATRSKFSVDEVGRSKFDRIEPERSRFERIELEKTRFTGSEVETNPDRSRFSSTDQERSNFLGNEASRSKFIPNDPRFQDNIESDKLPPWKKQIPFDMQDKRKRPSRFDPPTEELDHPKFRSANDQQMQPQNYQFQGQNPPNPISRPLGLQNPYSRPEPSSSFASEPKKGKRGLERLINTMLPTIQLENVPLSMKISDILDFFGNKYRGIVGCFRAIDYISKIPSRTVYIILMDENEVEMMENLREIYMEGNYVRISSAKLLNGSAVMDTTTHEIPGAPQSLFLTNLEKRVIETTFYIRELAKLFEPQFTITGIRICHNAKLRKSRNFGFVNFMSKASVDEFDGRSFRMFDYELRCSKTHKIPLLIHIDHAYLLEDDNTIPWNSQVRTLNLLNVEL